jgi:hypothetical protein
VYSTFLGGAPTTLALDVTGAATVAGSTTSIGFPTTAGAFNSGGFIGVSDAFVTRFSPTGSALLYSTFLGGLNDAGSRIAIDCTAVATMAEIPGSSDYPTIPGAFDTT